LAGMGIVAHPVRRLLRTATAIISLRIAVTSFREANAPAPPSRVTLVYDRGPNVGSYGRVGSGAAFAQGPWAASAAAMPSRHRRSSRLVPNSSSLLTQGPRRRSAGPANAPGTGAADETVRMAKGMLHASQAGVQSSSGVESPAVPNRPCSGQTPSPTLMRRDCPRFRREARRTPSSTTTPPARGWPLSRRPRRACLPRRTGPAPTASRAGGGGRGGGRRPGVSRRQNEGGERPEGDGLSRRSRWLPDLTLRSAPYDRDHPVAESHRSPRGRTRFIPLSCTPSRVGGGVRLRRDRPVSQPPPPQRDERPDRLQ
jgi:hypothetical protein